MEYKIIKKDQFTVAGVRKRIKSEAPYFTEVWNNFMDNYEKVKDSSVDDGFYGINEAPDENNVQDYIAGIAVDDSYQNSDSVFTMHVQPPSSYAVFECQVDTIGPTYMRIVSEWNDERYKVNDKYVPCFESYPPDTATPDAKILLHIPLIEKG